MSKTNFLLFFYFFVFVFANLKKKDFCEVQNQILGRDTYSMICYEEFKNPCTFVLKRVSHTGKKKERGRGKKTVYLFTTVKRQKTPNSYQGFLTTCQSYLNHVNDPESLTRSGGIPKSQDQSTQNPNISPP